MPTGGGNDLLLSSQESSHRQASQPRFQRTKRALVGLLLLTAFAAAVWFVRVPLLRGAAELWIVSDAVGPADAIVVLGGGLEERPFAAAEYYKQGLARKVLVSSVGVSRLTVLGILPSHTELNRMVLIKLGIPEAAIEIFGTRLANTEAEAVALREWAVRTHAQSLIVPTEDVSARRQRWVLEHVFAGSGISVRVPALSPSEYNDREWWRSPSGLLTFQNEILKYIYYRFKY
jgi:uncharacterized SAM-binding protein YcdF (DUF218 family)